MVDLVDVDPVAVTESERVECLLPAFDSVDEGLAVTAPGSDHEVEHYKCGLFGGKVRPRRWQAQRNLEFKDSIMLVL